ncbi:DUF7322 domain-containing protein [Haloarcula laminariae]|uniref:DUF7322 domain-containing protein n=1 Tax=Haloarcula laminariae TaxID=2961577 RepID=UPI0021C67E94|nr:MULTISPECIES: hypothetical protein [Halomicroarcula]
MLDGPDERDDGGVLSEKSPHEPDEFDPSSLGPDVPESPAGSGNSEVTSLFWKLVVVFNVALLALALGPMFAYFRGNVDFGLQLTAAGAILFAYGYFRYRQFVRERDDDESAAEGDEPDHNG